MDKNKQDKEPPISDEVWHRRMYALNKHLIEDMGEDVVITFGPMIIST